MPDDGKISLLGVENNEAVFIGDSDADIQAGKEANVHTVGVQWLPDYQTAEFDIKPDSFFNSVNQLVDFLQLSFRPRFNYLKVLNM